MWQWIGLHGFNKQNRHDLLPSLITQLSSQSDHFFDKLYLLYKSHNNGAHKPSEDTLIQCLYEMLMLPDQPPIYIIMNTLDKCPNTSRMPLLWEQVLDLLDNLIELSLPNLHLCITSHPNIDIWNALEPLTSRRVSLHEQSGQRQDIIDYVTLVIQSDPRMRRWRDTDKNLVIERLSDGM